MNSIRSAISSNEQLSGRERIVSITISFSVMRQLSNRTSKLCKSTDAPNETNSRTQGQSEPSAFAEIASRALSRPSVVRPLTYDLRDSCGRAVSLPAVDAYAGVATTATSPQRKRYRRATRECAESSACLGCVCSQSFATEAGETGEKNQALKSNIIRLG